jgi:hypothetical protein
MMDLLARRFRAAAVCAAVWMALPGGVKAQTFDTITVWKVGSPHRGEVPAAHVPEALAREAARNGLRLEVEAFPASGFASRLFDAIRRKAAPDVIAFDNMGVLNGITTALGTFTGIGEDPAIRRSLVQVTGAFDELLHPARGWTFLLSSSPNHKAARTLAVSPPACPNGTVSPGVAGELADTAMRVAAAYLTDDYSGVQHYLDPDRLVTLGTRPKAARVGGAAVCGIWGNNRLGVARVNASFEGTGTMGQSFVLLVFRKPGSSWQLLVAARDPLSTGDFTDRLPTLTNRLARETITGATAEPARLLTGDGVFPQPAAGQRFGDFTWRPSQSSDVIFQVAEFAYDDDARLFLLPSGVGAPGRLSAGQLWTTGGPWAWRIWSITQSGDVAFSSARTFTH